MRRAVRALRSVGSDRASISFEEGIQSNTEAIRRLKILRRFDAIDDHVAQLVDFPFEFFNPHFDTSCVVFRRQSLALAKVRNKSIHNMSYLAERASAWAL